jgi:sortase A
MKWSDTQAIIEQIALLFASFVWTTVILSVIALYWVYQDINARWEFIAQVPPEALAQADASPTPTPSPSPTLWPGPGPTRTPLPTLPPTPVPTLVVNPPAILPETFNADEPTPVPVVVNPTTEAAEPSGDNSLTPAPAPAEPNLTPPTSAPAQAPAPAVATGPGTHPARLIIESVGIDAPVTAVGWEVVEQNEQQYSIWQVADFAAGWHNTSAGLGQPGNTVMAGHHNVKGEVFRDLVNVERGDKITVYDESNQKFEYVVDLKTIVKEKGEPLEVRQRNAQWIAPTDDERLTFITCWPYTNNTHRVIVVAKPI